MDRYSGNRGELNFEDDLVEHLIQMGWDGEILQNIPVKQKTPYSEEGNVTSLEGNFRRIINKRNRKFYFFKYI